MTRGAAAAAVPLDRVCIVMLAAVGDAVHALPVINAIKRHQPSSHISWVLQPGLLPFLDGHPAVDELIPFDRKRGWRGFLDVRRRLRERAFDVVLVLQPYLKAGLVASFAPAPVRLGLDRRRARDVSWAFTNRTLPPRPSQHTQDQYLEFLTWLGIDHGPLVWNLGPWDHERAWQREFFAPFERPAASIVVATSKPEKDWPPERWAEVVDALHRDFGLQPVLVGGRSPREVHAEQVIAQRASHKPVSALGSGLRKLVSILDGSALVLAPDTGPLHMSVALERPAISLMGYTNPKRTGPYRRYHDLMIDAYGDPGEDYPISMENRPGRMARITVRDVLDRVERWRTTYAPGAASSGPKE